MKYRIDHPSAQIMEGLAGLEWDIVVVNGDPGHVVCTCYTLEDADRIITLLRREENA